MALSLWLGNVQRPFHRRFICPEDPKNESGRYAGFPRTPNSNFGMVPVLEGFRQGDVEHLISAHPASPTLCWYAVKLLQKGRVTFINYQGAPPPQLSYGRLRFGGTVEIDVRGDLSCKQQSAGRLRVVLQYDQNNQLERVGSPSSTSSAAYISFKAETAPIQFKSIRI